MRVDQSVRKSVGALGGVPMCVSLTRMRDNHLPTTTKTENPIAPPTVTQSETPPRVEVMSGFWYIRWNSHAA